MIPPSNIISGEICRQIPDRHIKKCNKVIKSLSILIGKIFAKKTMQEDMITQPLYEGSLVITIRYPNPSRFLFIFKWLFSISGFASSEASSFWHIWPQLGNVPALQQNNKLLRNERLRYICCEAERSYSLKYSASLFSGSVIALLKFHQVATRAGLDLSPSILDIFPGFRRDGVEAKQIT